MQWLRWAFVGTEGVRSGWRVLLFGALTFAGLLGATLVVGLLALGIAMATGEPPSVGMGLALAPVIYLPTLVVAALCSALVDRDGLRAAGVGGPWLRSGLEVLGGAALGGALVPVGVLLLWALSFGVDGAAVSVTLTDRPAALLWAPLVLALLVLAGAWEEVLFRGYGFVWAGRAAGNLLVALAAPLGLDVDRVRPAALWCGRVPVVLGSAVVFSLVHLGNPGNAGLLPLINTTLAGLWLTAAVYWNRALWFAIGMHFSWNATMAMVVGIPVSGVGAEGSGIVLPSLFRTTLSGPDWFTGASYGMEGSVGAVGALAVGTLLVMLCPRRAPELGMAALHLGRLEAPGRVPR